MFLLSACASLAAAATAPTRPSLLTNAAPGDVVHYFGVGSNMLRSKIVSRGINGSSIEVLEMRPALVRGHRLAFNMRGFPHCRPRCVQQGAASHMEMGGQVLQAEPSQGKQNRSKAEEQQIDKSLYRLNALGVIGWDGEVASSRGFV